jgi:NADH:ubiquinone oxidoreductase subunit K
MNLLHDYHLLNSSLLIAVVLFVLGAVGFAARRNLIVMFFSAAIMLQAVSLSLCAFGNFHGDWTGRTAGWMILALTTVFGILVAAVAVVLVERRRTLDISDWTELGNASPISEESDSSPSDEAGHD